MDASGSFVCLDCLANLRSLVNDRLRNAAVRAVVCTVFPGRACVNLVGDLGWRYLLPCGLDRVWPRCVGVVAVKKSGRVMCGRHLGFVSLALFAWTVWGCLT